MVTRAKAKNATKSVRTRKKPAPKKAVAVNMQNLDDEIKQRAYEVYEQRGGMPGSDVSDWLQAEKDVKAKHGISA